jgi:hypothetical protein
MHCEATTKRGARCHNLAQPGSRFCHLHGVSEPQPLQRDENVEVAVPALQRVSRVSARAARVADPQTSVNPLLQTLASVLNDAQPAGRRPSPALKTKQSISADAGPAKTNGADHKPAEDPFEALAAAVSAAAAAAEKAAPQGSDHRKRRGPPAEPMAKAIYAAAYGIGYGVALPTFLLLGMLPDNALGRGLKDGAKAAKKAVDRRRKK